MLTKILSFTTIISFSFIVSQSLMYILALKNVQYNLDFNSYTEFRKLIDTSMRANFKYAIYLALFFNLALVISTAKNPGSLIFITSAFALTGLIIDVLITVKGNLPINDIINSWSPENQPANWTEFRAKWFELFKYRQIANITAYLSLLIGIIFGAKVS